jgi:hypothetical protein
MTPPETRYARSGDLRIAYEIVGKCLPSSRNAPPTSATQPEKNSPQRGGDAEAGSERGSRNAGDV